MNNRKKPELVNHAADPSEKKCGITFPRNQGAIGNYHRLSLSLGMKKWPDVGSKRKCCDERQDENTPHKITVVSVGQKTSTDSDPSILFGKYISEQGNPAFSRGRPDEEQSRSGFD